MSARCSKRMGRRADKRMAQGWHATSAEQRGYRVPLEVSKYPAQARLPDVSAYMAHILTPLDLGPFHARLDACKT